MDFPHSFPRRSYLSSLYCFLCLCPSSRASLVCPDVVIGGLNLFKKCEDFCKCLSSTAFENHCTAQPSLSVAFCCFVDVALCMLQEHSQTRLTRYNNLLPGEIPTEVRLIPKPCFLKTINTRDVYHVTGGCFLNNFGQKGGEKVK